MVLKIKILAKPLPVGTLLIVILLLKLGCVSANTADRSDQKLPLVINTWTFQEANAAAWTVLNHHPGGNALDALVEGCSTCERLQCDGTVGYGGSPDENGETTLDAMIMDGADMNIGAVAAMRQIKDAARVARFVMEHTHHTLLVGEAASEFGEMMGFRRETLVTPESKETWQEWRNKNCQPNFWRNVYPDGSKQCGPYKPMSERHSGKDARERYKIGRWNHDTIGMIVMNEVSQIYAGTSTNGARHKIPGRVGDSPIPGAGAYADNEVGAAVATGDGDIMMRFLPSLLAVEALRSSRTPAEAAHYAMQRIVRFYPDFSGALVVVDRFGNYSAACVGMERFPYSIVSGDATQHTRVEYKICKEEIDFY